MLIMSSEELTPRLFVSCSFLIWMLTSCCSSTSSEALYRTAATLSHGDQKLLDIALALVLDPKVLLLDEPTAGMGAAEGTRTAEILRALVGRHSVLVIDHDIDFVEQLGGHVAVLHQGRLFKEGSLAEVRSDPDVASIYLGRPKA